jgi:hypothetical protein
MSKQNILITTTEVPSVAPNTGIDPSVVLKLAEYGGFIASMLALCAFFWVLTQFVKQIKED